MSPPTPRPKEGDTKTIKGRRYVYHNGSWLTGKQLAGIPGPGPTPRGAPVGAPTPTPRGTSTYFPSRAGLRAYEQTQPLRTRVGPTPPEVPPPETPWGPGEIPPPNIKDYYITVEPDGTMLPVPYGTPGAIFDNERFYADQKAYNALVEGDGGAGGGGGGPSAEELAMARERLESDKLASYMDSIIAGVSADIDAKRLTTEQAMSEFTRRLDALSEAGTQYKAMAQYAVPTGTEYAPGFQPGGVATRLGLEPRRATPIRFDPFKTAVELIESTPNLAEIGAPSTLPGWDEALALARRFAGLG